MRIMKATGGRVVLDIDYRPNPWGLVGTEEEVLIASGEATLSAALRAFRAQLHEWPVTHCMKCLCFYHPVGRTLFASAADDWFAGRISDADAVSDMAGRFQSLISACCSVRGHNEF